MRRALASLPLALLLIAYLVPSNAQKGAEEVLHVREGEPLELTCALRVEQRVEWHREGGAMPAELRPAGEAAAPGGLTARLRAEAARAHLAGVYACARGPAAQRLRVVVEPADASAARDVPASGAETTVAPAPAAAEAGADQPSIFYYEVGSNATINCTLPNPSNLPISWMKNGTAVDTAEGLKGRFDIRANGTTLFIYKPTNEADYGNYSCALPDGTKQHLRLHGRPYTKLPSTNTNSVEGQPLKLTCRVVGRPADSVDWFYVNTTDDTEELGIDALAALGDNAIVRAVADIQNAELVLNTTRALDAGRYTCVPRVAPAARSSRDPAHTVLRVKDKYAALWPFLGICAEVLVLCAVILVYEKRRTKPELDDSDTDNHDQKKS